MSKKIKISIKGQEIEYETDQAAMAAVGKVLYDIISPVAEGFGAIGDKIRVYRTKSLADILSEAEKIAAEKNVLLENVSPKFMTQWVEGASAENTESDDSLKSLWANLLVNVANDDSLAGSGYVSIIKQLEPRHARMLNAWVNDASFLTKLVGFMYGQIPRYQDVAVEGLATIVSRCIRKEFNSVIDTKSFLGDNILKEFNERFTEFRQSTDEVGVEVTSLSINNVFIPTSFRPCGTSPEEGVSNSALVDRDFLCRLGFLTFRTKQGVVLDKDDSYVAHYYGLTSLAISFINAVGRPLAKTSEKTK